MLVGGYSDKDKCGKVYAIDFIGFMAEETKFTSLGSGMYYAFGVLEANYKDNMTEEEGIELARKALKAAKERDVGSGYGVNCGYNKRWIQSNRRSINSSITCYFDFLT